MNDPRPILASRYSPAIIDRPRLKAEDWSVATVTTSDAIEQSDIVTKVRLFIAAMSEEVTARRDDPIATGQALARVDAILADMRYLRSLLAATTADAMNRMRIKTITVETIATWEATASYKRSGWRHRDLLVKVLDATSLAVIDTDTGERLPTGDVADIILSWLTPGWKLTGLRPYGVDPDDYCTVATDDEGNPTKEVGIRFHSNRERNA